MRRSRWLLLTSTAVSSALLAILAGRPQPPDDAQCTRPARQATPEDTAALRHAEALLDEASGLTPTEVFLDERASERWLPQIADLQRRAEDPSASAAERAALVALLRRLEALGL